MQHDPWHGHRCAREHHAAVAGHRSVERVERGAIRSEHVEVDDVARLQRRPDMNVGLSSGRDGIGIGCDRCLLERDQHLGVAQGRVTTAVAKGAAPDGNHEDSWTKSSARIALDGTPSLAGPPAVNTGGGAGH